MYVSWRMQVQVSFKLSFQFSYLYIYIHVHMYLEEVPDILFGDIRTLGSLVATESGKVLLRQS